MFKMQNLKGGEGKFVFLSKIIMCDDGKTTYITCTKKKIRRYDSFITSMDCVEVVWFVLDSMDYWRSCLDLVVGIVEGEVRALPLIISDLQLQLGGHSSGNFHVQCTEIEQQCNDH